MSARQADFVIEALPDAGFNLPKQRFELWRSGKPACARQQLH